MLVPAVEQVAAAELINGVAGAGNIAALVNKADAAEVQLPILAVTV